MAKKKVSKSDAIRDQLKKTPKAKNKEVREALAKTGVDVADALISNVRGRMGGKKKVRRVKKKKVAARSTKRKTKRVTGGASLTVDSLLQARSFAEKVGGVGKAQELLAALEKLNG